jgi:glucose/arabinose dehydrogenase
MQGTLTVEPGDGGGGDDLPLPSLDDAPGGPVTLGHVVPTPTSLTVHGDAMYIASWGTGTIFRAPILDGGLLGAAESFATGFSNPLGVQVDEHGVVYVADSHPSARADRATAGRVTAIPPEGGDRAAVGQTLVDELPNGRHNTNGMAVHDGRLYITNGNSTDDGLGGGEPEEPLSGSLVSIALPALPLDPAAAPVVVDPADGLAVPGLQVEAIGMRNDYDVAFRPGTSEAWITMNGLDMQDPYGEDLLLVADVADGDIEDFGFPGCQYAAGDPNPAQNTNPAVTDTCGDDHVPPAALLGLHTSADGLAFGPAGTTFEGAVYIARFGNFFGSQVVGHDVAMVPVAADGTAGEAQTFLPGPAPLDLTFGPAGLYVADFSGVITLIPAP